jgi:hypothetical protein
MNNDVNHDAPHGGNGHLAEGIGIAHPAYADVPGLFDPRNAIAANANAPPANQGDVPGIFDPANDQMVLGLDVVANRNASAGDQYMLPNGISNPPDNNAGNIRAGAENWGTYFVQPGFGIFSQETWPDRGYLPRHGANVAETGNEHPDANVNAAPAA